MPHLRALSLSSWLPVVALSLITLLIQGCTIMALGVYLGPVGGDLGPIGGGATMLLLAMSLASWPVGWALQRLGARPVLWAGIMLVVAGCLAAWQAPDRLVLALALGIAGLGIGAATIVPGVAIITHLHPARRGLPLAIFLGASVIAGAFLPPLVAAVMSFWGWRMAFLLSALAIAAICTPLVLLVPNASIARAPDHGADGLFAHAIRTPGFLPLAIAMTLLQLSINGILFSAVDSLMAQGMSQAGAVAAYSIANLLGLPALLLGGVLADRIGARAALIGTALLLAAGTLALLAAGPMGMAGIAAFVLVWGVASALPGQSGSMLLADVVEPHVFAGLLGVNTAIFGLVGALAPAWTDQLRGWSGDLSLPIAIYAALAMAAVPFIARVRPRGS